MTTAVWRPRPDASYPVLGVESNGYIDGLVDIVFEAPDGSKSRGFVRMRDIEVRPRSIVRALTADFTDHSAPDRCRCAERAEGPLTPLSPRAQASAAGDAAEAPNFPAATRVTHTHSQIAGGDSTSSSNPPRTERDSIMAVQQAGIFTTDYSAQQRNKVALIAELRNLLTATIPGEDGYEVLAIDGPLRSQIVDLLRDALGIDAIESTTNPGK